jgi:NDP-sugar pyrophosphorylase family protein
VVSPEVLNRVPADKHFDMPELLQSLIRDDLLPAAFPIHEYWIDVGRVEDYQRAHFDYPEFFG